MKKKIIGNIIIVLCVIGIFGIVLESGYSIGRDRATAHYEKYQSARDASIKNILNSTNDSYDEITKKVDKFLNASYDESVDFSKIIIN